MKKNLHQRKRPGAPVKSSLKQRNNSVLLEIQKMRTSFCFAALLISLSANAEDLKYKSLVENVATLSVVAKWCDDYKVDIRSTVAFLAETKVNITKAPYEKIFDDTKELLEGLMGKVGTEKFCAITYERYKPGGPISGMMMKR